MNTTMKAIQVTEFGDAESLQISEVSIPTPKVDEVLVRNHAIGVNFVDTQHRAGNPYPIELPLIIGIESAGEVVAVGEEVCDVVVGQRVGVTHMGGIYAEYCLCPAERIIPLPETVTYEQAAAGLLQGMTAYALSHDAYTINAGDVVLIQAAAGGVGLLLTQMAKMCGAQVIGTCSTELKANAIRQAGGDQVILYNDADVLEEVMSLTQGEGVHVVYDAVGQATFDMSLDCLRPQGHIVIFGLASGNIPPFDVNRLSGIAGHSSQGALSLTWASLSTYNAHRENMLQRAGVVLDWVANGELSVVIAGRFPLEQANHAHHLLESRQAVGKILLMP